MDKITGLNNRSGNQFNCAESTLLMINDKHPLPNFRSNIMKTRAQGESSSLYLGMLTFAGLIRLFAGFQNLGVILQVIN